MEPTQINGRLVLLGEENSGRDEMNLGGNPFALLQASSRSGQTQIIREFERELPSGQLIKARWKVEGDQELGLPGPSEELIYLILLQLTREAADENGVWPQRVNFSRYDVLMRLKWPANGHSYNALRDCLVRLKAVTIVADNAFWDARTKTPFKTVSFNIIGNFGIADEPKMKSGIETTPLSWFEWDRVVYESFLAGNVRSLALDFTLSLELAISRRLFRLLDLLRKSRQPPRTEVRLELLDLRDRLAMSNKYIYGSKIKQVLEPAIEELTSRGYLAGVKYEKVKKVETAIFVFASVYPEIEGERVGQGRGEELLESPTPKATKTKTKPIQLPLLEAEAPNDVRADAMKCHALFQTLDEREKAELLELAKQEVNPIWHDRVGQPESPMSLGLWQLVAERYAERLK